MEPQTLVDFCNDEMRAVEQLLDQAGTLEGEALLWASNQMDARLSDVMSLSGLLREVHPSAGVRDAASYCEQVGSSNATAVGLSRPLYDALLRLHEEQRRRRGAAAAEVPPLDPALRGDALVASYDAVRYVTKSLERFRRSGVGVVPAEEEPGFFAAVTRLSRRATELEQAYQAELSGDRRGVWVVLPKTHAAANNTAPARASLGADKALPLSDATSLQGLPEDFVAARVRSVPSKDLTLALDAARAIGEAPAPLAGGSSQGDVTVVELSTDYPDSSPVFAMAADRGLRAALALQTGRRGFPDNQATLAALLGVRQERSRLLAEAKAAASNASATDADACSPAALTLEPMMAKTPAAVRDLLVRVLGIAMPPGQRERAALTKLLAELPQTPGLPKTPRSYDLGFLLDRVRASAFNASTQLTRQYFTYAQARRGVLTTAARAFSLRFAVVAAPSVADPGALGAKATDRQLDACLRPRMARSLDVCEHPVVTPLDEAAVAAEASAVPEAHRWHPSVEVIDVYAAADGSDERLEAPKEASIFSSDPGLASDRGAYIGRLYIDAFPRADKYKHMAMFPITPGMVRWAEPAAERLRRRAAATTAKASRAASLFARAAAGARGAGGDAVMEQHPEAALVCNFEPTGQMDHDDVVTLFHEFGHALHHLLGGRAQRFADFSGASTETDFVEVPSQLNEAFAWDPVVLASFAARLRSDEELAAAEAAPGAEDPSDVEPIPAELVERLRAAHAAGRALSQWRQAWLSLVSLRLHTGEFRFDEAAERAAAAATHGRSVVTPGGEAQATLQPEDPSGASDARPRCPAPPAQPTLLDDAIAAITEASSPFPTNPGTHLASNFGHLVGYGPAYYSYTWSDVIVKDMLVPFEEARDRSAVEAARWNATDATEEERDEGGDRFAGSLLAARSAALRYRSSVLEAGARADGDALVRSFLGRDVDYAAFERWLTEGLDSPWLKSAGA